MSEESIYKIVEPVKEVKEEPKKPPGQEVVTPEADERPPSLMDKPYLASLLEIGEAYEHFNMKKLVSEINEFVLSEIKREGMEDSSKSYKEIIDAYLDRLKLSENVDIYTKIEKLNKLMRIDKKLIEAAQDKESLLKADPKDLTADQIKEKIWLSTSPEIRNNTY